MLTETQKGLLMKIASLGDNLGGIVLDLPIDFTHLSLPDRDAIAEAYDEYGLLLFRGRELSVDEQIAICNITGKVVDQAGNGKNWFNITNLGGGYEGRLCFHADYSNTENLLTGASLYASVLPNGSTATIFAHTGRAFSALPEELRTRMHGRRAVHAAMRDGGPTTPETPVRHQPQLAIDPRAEHPLEFVHPKTGESLLFVSDLQTEYIRGMDPEESVQLLDELSAWIQQPQFVYRHQWQLYDLVLWDQIVMQHSREAESVEGERTLRRVSFTYPKWHELCQEFFTSLGGRAGRSGQQKVSM